MYYGVQRKCSHISKKHMKKTIVPLSIALGFMKQCLHRSHLQTMLLSVGQIHVKLEHEQKDIFKTPNHMDSY